MKNVFTKWCALCLSLVLTALIAGCGEKRQEAVRVGSLKGPTSIGLLSLMEKAEKQETKNEYAFQMATGADELLALMAKGELDIALVPANVAATLYHRTNGGVTVIDLNTLGVLYLVSGDGSIDEIRDLEGRTVYLTGKGTTPDYCLRYLLEKNGLDVGVCALEYKSEASEVAAVLAENPEAVGLLPQPFVTAACLQNEALSAVVDLNAEWNRVRGEEGGIVTGVTVVRNEFLQEREKDVQTFLQEHAESVASVNGDVEHSASLAVEAGIVAKEPIAKKAIPNCNIVCVTGENMKIALQGYLQVLCDFSPDAVGGGMPGDDFYYVP